MKRTLAFMALMAALGLTAGPGAFGQSVDPGVAVLASDKLDLAIYGRGQMIGVGEIVPDHLRDHDRVYLFLKQARLGVKGRYEDLFKYDLQLSFGGEDANGSNTDLSLLDFVADVPIRPLGEDTIFKIGQFRVPYSREGLTDRGYMDFGDRSIMNLASYQTRDYGLALMKNGTWTGTFGVFSAGGRDVPQRYLPERLGVPEVVARVGYNDGVDQDIYHVMGTDLNLKRTTKAVYLNALYMQDTLIGHSTILNLRTIDKNLLIDSNYNPYINAGPNNAAGSASTLQRGNIYFVGGDAVVRHPLGEGKALEGEVEGNWGGYQNRFGVIHIAAARAQGDYQFAPFELGLRYAVLSMDTKSGYINGGKIINPHMGTPIHEITPSLTWHVKNHNLKIVADAPIYLNCPVFYDNALGAYAFPDPTSVDQDSVLSTAGNNTVRRTIPEARMLFQFMF